MLTKAVVATFVLLSLELCVVAVGLPNPAFELTLKVVPERLRFVPALYVVLVSVLVTVSVAVANPVT